MCVCVSAPFQRIDVMCDLMLETIWCRIENSQLSTTQTIQSTYELFFIRYFDSVCFFFWRFSSVFLLNVWVIFHSLWFARSQSVHEYTARSVWITENSWIRKEKRRHFKERELYSLTFMNWTVKERKANTSKALLAGIRSQATRIDVIITIATITAFISAGVNVYALKWSKLKHFFSRSHS